ncbi:hypothetical protein ACQEVZ_42070 [Dactylosporangium sp. CA-152071]|uniref:hypothetical protein n=1 Tax=Dactylosporangium sp. CA-152071 TaxID=3239933 RepID=UPI003D8F9126
MRTHHRFALAPGPGQLPAFPRWMAGRHDRRPADLSALILRKPSAATRPPTNSAVRHLCLRLREFLDLDPAPPGVTGPAGTPHPTTRSPPTQHCARQQIPRNRRTTTPGQDPAARFRRSTRTPVVDSCVTSTGARRLNSAREHRRRHAGVQPNPPPR